MKALTTRFESRTLDKNFLIATAVDPRFKVKFLDDESRAVLIRETNRLKPAVEVREKTARAQNHHDLWDCYDEIIKDHDSVNREQSANNDITSEVSAFLALHAITATSFLSLYMVAYKSFGIAKPFSCCVKVLVCSKF
jgi:hypothetical protein